RTDKRSTLARERTRRLRSANLPGSDPAEPSVQPTVAGKSEVRLLQHRAAWQVACGDGNRVGCGRSSFRRFHRRNGDETHPPNREGAYPHRQRTMLLAISAICSLFCTDFELISYARMEVIMSSIS